MVVNLLLFIHLFCSRRGTWIRVRINRDCSVVHKQFAIFQELTVIWIISTFYVICKLYEKFCFCCVRTEQSSSDIVCFQVSKIGVFSCGPRPLTKSIMSACEEVNKGRKLPYFIHHFENFG